MLQKVSIEGPEKNFRHLCDVFKDINKDQIGYKSKIIAFILINDPFD